MKKLWLALKLHGGAISVDGLPDKIRLPDGCVGIMFPFKTKKTARNFWGKDVRLVEIEECERRLR